MKANFETAIYTCNSYVTWMWPHVSQTCFKQCRGLMPSPFLHRKQEREVIVGVSSFLRWQFFESAVYISEMKSNTTFC